MLQGEVHRHRAAGRVADGCDTNFRGKRGKIVLEKRKEAR